MPDCPRISTCPFFGDRISDMPAMAQQMKKRYCRTDCTHCARYMVASILGREKVPMDLFPSQTRRAQALIAAH